MSSPVFIEQVDSAIDVLLSDPDVAIPNADSEIAELLGLAAELRSLPRPGFRAQLKFELMERVYAEAGVERPELRVLDSLADRPQVTKQARQTQEQILPTLFGQGYGIYGVRHSNFAVSAFAHAVALSLLLTSSLWLVHGKPNDARILTDVAPMSDYISLTQDVARSGGGGGGGDRDKVAAPEGRLPKLAMQQITPPEVVIRNEHPKFVAEATVVVPPQLNLANNHMPNLGDPTSHIIGPPSNGTGATGGIGAGEGGGVGSGGGAGVGPGLEAGFGGGIYNVGGGVSAPRAVYKPEPEYSPEARQAKYQGTVVVSLVVGSDGKPHSVHIAHSLGMGLDEKAIEAVQQWRFEPALKDGRPVPVAVNIEVNFRLF